VLHDSGWPYGRRDLYYDPASVPEAYRQPWQRGPLLPHEPGIADYGLNAHLRHSLREGGPRNGVRTAIDDFLLEHPGKFRVVHVPVLFGLTVLAPTALLSPALRTYLDSLELSPPLRRLLEAAELERCYGIAATQRLGPLPLALDLPHAEPVLGRSFSSQLPAEVLAAIQGGTLQYQYRGRALLKSPFDLALYLRLLGDLRPRTVIEIGSSQGGSALWFADMMTNFAIRGTVITIDREQPQRIEDARISFLSADASDLSGILSEQLLANLPKPWLVVEDSAHTYDVCLGVLRFFDSYLASGDYIIVEDGIVRGLPGEQYRGYLDGPSRAIETFLSTRAADYEIDTNYCDFYGSNVTYCPNGWLRRR
jgi:cephalosporin hydroxylase